MSASGKMVTNASEPVSYYDLSKAYEHKLQRTAYNFCYGPFGGVFAKDFICVQSIDGQLSFYEQESHTFSRFLDGYVLPSPICYVPKLDSFLLANTALELQCYKYQVLGAASGAEGKREEEEDGVGAGIGKGAAASASSASKKIQTDWSINLGEQLLKICVARYSRSLAASQVDILVLGEHTLFTLKEQGTVRLQKRLDYNPSSVCPYNNTAENPKDDVGGANQNIIIATHQSSLMIYKDTQLVWAARTSAIPVAVRVGNFASVSLLTSHLL